MTRVDLYGHCIKCGKNMVLKRAVTHPTPHLEDMFHVDHDHTEFILNNNSRMMVCMCKPCKKSVDLTDPKIHDEIMDSVMAGWQLEQDTLVSEDKQTQEGRKKVMDHHKDLDILFHSEGMADYVIEDKIEKIKEVRVKGT